MKKAIVIYQSKTGITRKFGEEIGKYLTGKSIEVKVLHVGDYTKEIMSGAELILIGCWTAGFMLMFQHPDKVWKKFAAGLPHLDGKKTALFTTYKIATGSMFKCMRKHLQHTGSDFPAELRSRDGSLSDVHKQQLDGLLG